MRAPAPATTQTKVAGVEMGAAAPQTTQWAGGAAQAAGSGLAAPPHSSSRLALLQPQPLRQGSATPTAAPRPGHGAGFAGTPGPTAGGPAATPQASAPPAPGSARRRCEDSGGAQADLGAGAGGARGGFGLGASFGLGGLQPVPEGRPAAASQLQAPPAAAGPRGTAGRPAAQGQGQRAGPPLLEAPAMVEGLGEETDLRSQLRKRRMQQQAALPGGGAGQGGAAEEAEQGGGGKKRRMSSASAWK